MPLPPAVSALVTERLDAVDAALPGFVTALWVTGSAASGDWRPDRSDVDFVAATDRVPTLADLEAAEQPAAHVTNGEFGTGPCGQCTPAAWLELRQDGVAVRGPAPAELVPAPEPAALRSWLLGNLRGYWSDTAGHAERVGTERPATAPVDGYPVVWMVLGAPRLHATLTTGRIVSKTAAGAYAAERFPDHAELAGRCVRWRAGEPEEFTMADGLRAAALIRAVVSTAETAAQAR